MSVSSPYVDAEPFDLEPTPGDATGAAALCLHGFTGTPYEVRPVAEQLVSRGIRARGIWMAGHGGSVEDLGQVSGEEWVARAKDELANLRAQYRKVFLVGVSMGGLVSLSVASSENVDGMVIVGVPLVFAPPIPQLVPILSLFRKNRPKGESDLQDPEARAKHPRFPATPLRAVRELIGLQRRVIPELDSVSTPILVAHGEHDQTARPRDAQRIYVSVRSEKKELLMLPRSGHVATVDYDGPALCKRSAEFLSEL